MSDLLLGVIVGGIFGVGGGAVNAFIQWLVKRGEMKETRRRDAAAAALEIMKAAPDDDKKRNKFVGHYQKVYTKLLKTLRAPEE